MRMSRGGALARVLRENLPEKDVTLRIFEGEIGTHREPSWRAQFPLAIEAMFTPKE